MTEKELNDKIEEKATASSPETRLFSRSRGSCQALVLKTADNKNLDFGEDIQEDR